MSWLLPYLAGIVTVPAGCALAYLASVATARVRTSCRRCGWSTGRTRALPGWARWRWHRHITRPLGRCQPTPVARRSPWLADGRR